MLFTLKPTICHLALALPVLLTALPAALGADQDKLGPALPPPSLYDVPPTAQPASAAAPAPVSTPAATTPAAPQAPAAKAPEPVKATPSAAAPALNMGASAGAPQAAATTAGESKEPWYRSFVYWLFGRPSTQQAKAQPASAAQPAVAARTDAPTALASAPEPAVAQVNASVPAGEPPRHYASDASNRTIRAGMTGDCVKMGTWTPDSANADCHAPVVAAQPAPVKTAPAVTPKSVSAASATVIALNQPPKPMPAGSAPAPTSVREYAPRLVEPVEVVPLPPAPPAATEERPLEAEHVQSAEEEPITALAAVTPAVSEPEFDKLSLSAGGLFALSSTKIKPSGQEKLDEMVEHLRGMQYGSVLVVGHTDPTGSKAMNDKLSKQRAQSVKQYLISKGVDPKRIKTEGKGGAEPVAKTQNCDSLPRAEKIACYAPDRRVDIEVVGGSPHG
jgi:OOP family OmpA-OmpF porin